MDFGLLGGWSAGGPATATPTSFPAQSGAQVSADIAAAGAHDSAFVELMNGFAATVATPAEPAAIAPTLIPIVVAAVPQRFNEGSEFDASAVAVLPPVFQFEVPAESTLLAAETGLEQPVSHAGRGKTERTVKEAIEKPEPDITDAPVVVAPFQFVAEPVRTEQDPARSANSSMKAEESEAEDSTVAPAILPQPDFIAQPALVQEPARKPNSIGNAPRSTEPLKTASAADQLEAVRIEAGRIDQQTADSHESSVAAATPSEFKEAEQLNDASFIPAEVRKAAGAQRPHRSDSATLAEASGGAPINVNAPVQPGGNQEREASNEDGRRQAPNPSTAGAVRSPMRNMVEVVESKTRAEEPPTSPTALRSFMSGLRPWAGADRHDDSSAPSASVTGPAFKASQILMPGVMSEGLLSAAIHRSAPLSSTPDATPDLPASTAQQIVQSIRLSWVKGGGEARITLDPQQFGDLAVTMRVERGSVVASLQAESPAVREWIRTNQDVLRAGLAEHQLRLDRLDVHKPEEAHEAPQDEGQHRDAEQHSQGQRRRRPQHSEVFDIVA